MHCVAVSDIHMRDVSTPDGDLLLVAGDMTFLGERYELDWFSDWLLRQPQAHKVWIAGNHEIGLEKFPGWSAEYAERSMSIYLEDAGLELDGIKIWGSPVTPFFRNWAFNRHRGDEIMKHWRRIPEGLDILLTHGPPFGYMDLDRAGNSVGCRDLLCVLEQMQAPPKYVVFGHIHSGYGQAELRRADGKVVHLINASVCDERYMAVNEPICFSI